MEMILVTCALVKQPPWRAELCHLTAGHGHVTSGASLMSCCLGITQAAPPPAAHSNPGEAPL